MGISLVCSHLYKKYKGNDYYSLADINFSVKLNGIFSIIGRNGAGKTTLIRILSTQLLPTSGTVILDGLDVVKEANKLREEIAIVPQEARLISWLTVYENIFNYLVCRGLSFSEAKSRAIKVIRQFKLTKYADKLPEKLSGGIKRKALVAEVIASGAKIIFLDEPTTGLDPLSRRDLWKILKKIKKNKLIILTTHYLEEAEELSDVIAIINKGKLIAIGSLNDLRKKVKYPFVIRVAGHFNPKKINAKVIRTENSTQIYLSEENAKKLSKKLLEENKEFYTSPISLADVFYFLVKR